jgi:hypothetical protein
MSVQNGNRFHHAVVEQYTWQFLSRTSFEEGR